MQTQTQSAGCKNCRNELLWHKSSKDVPMCLWPYAIWWLFCLSPSVWWGTYVRRRWMLLCLFVFAGLFLPFLRALLVLNKQWRFLEKWSDYYRFQSFISKYDKSWVQVCNKKKRFCTTENNPFSTYSSRARDVYFLCSIICHYQNYQTITFNLDTSIRQIHLKRIISKLWKLALLIFLAIHHYLFLYLA